MNALSYSLTRTFESLDIFRNKLAADLAAGGIGESDASSIELCLYEVIANIIEHEEAPPSDPNILISVSLGTDESVSCTLVWQAREFDLTQRPLPDLERHFAQGNKNGLGIYIIHTLMDKLEYNHNGKCSMLTMEKNLKHRVKR